jgi:hypothetical protein
MSTIKSEKDYESQLDSFFQIHSDYVAKRKRILGELEFHAKDKHLTDVKNRIYERTQFDTQQLNGFISQSKVDFQKERKKLEDTKERN